MSRHGTAVSRLILGGLVLAGSVWIPWLRVEVASDTGDYGTYLLNSAFRPVGETTFGTWPAVLIVATVLIVAAALLTARRPAVGGRVGVLLGSSLPLAFIVALSVTGPRLHSAASDVRGSLVVWLLGVASLAAGIRLVWHPGATRALSAVVTFILLFAFVAGWLGILDLAGEGLAGGSGIRGSAGVWLLGLSSTLIVSGAGRILRGTFATP
jgi:hypothetical protein